MLLISTRAFQRSLAELQYKKLFSLSHLSKVGHSQFLYGHKHITVHASHPCRNNPLPPASLLLLVTRGVSLLEKVYESFSDLKILRFWDRICGFFQIFSGFFGVFHPSTMTFPFIKMYRDDSMLDDKLSGDQKVRNLSTGKCM